MKVKLFGGLIAMMINTYAFSGCIGPTVLGECSGTKISDPYSHESNSNNNGIESSYKSYSGTQYQYDMSKSSDSLRYSVDIAAQQRDKMNFNSSRSIDRKMGQYGGGVYSD